MTEPSWVAPTHRALIDAGIGIVGYVPDGGLSHLIIRLDSDTSIATVPLTTEEEGVALAAGAWLGGERAALLMQSSGVGNCTNMLSLLAACEIPAFILVIMRGQHGETNPWQLPMGRAAGPSMELMGIDVRSATSPDDVGPAVTRACLDTFGGGTGATAVLINQAVIGAKTFGDTAFGNTAFEDTAFEDTAFEDTEAGQ